MCVRGRHMHDHTHVHTHRGGVIPNHTHTYTHRRGHFKAIGVSNYEASHLQELLRAAEVPPQVNQIEVHPRRCGYVTCVLAV